MIHWVTLYFWTHPYGELIWKCVVMWKICGIQIVWVPVLVTLCHYVFCSIWYIFTFAFVHGQLESFFGLSPPCCYVYFISLKWPPYVCPIPELHYCELCVCSSSVLWALVIFLKQLVPTKIIKIYLFWIVKIQLRKMNMDHLLNKPYVNGVFLRGQKLLLKCC